MITTKAPETDTAGRVLKGEQWFSVDICASQRDSLMEGRGIDWSVIGMRFAKFGARSSVAVSLSRFVFNLQIVSLIASSK